MNKSKTVITIALSLFIISWLGISKAFCINKEYETNVKTNKVITTTYTNTDSEVAAILNTETSLSQIDEIITTPKTGVDSIAKHSESSVDSSIDTETIIAITELVETEESPTNYAGVFEGTWYCAADMGYTSPPYGSSGRTLETGYSVASNYFEPGTLLYIEGDGITGTYRVDDTGIMSNNVIDFYYWDRDYIPESFLIAGRINIQVYVIGKGT